MPHLQLFNYGDLQALLSKREGETKLGESVCLVGNKTLDEALVSFSGRFVVLGLPEDIGVRANGGIGGAETAWPTFLKSFINIQQTGSLSGTDFMIAGSLNFDEWLEACRDADIETLRKYTAQIDATVFVFVQKIVEYGKIPVVIGGGHNNAYPLLKGLSIAKGKPVNAINLDAHSDFRRAEGRHSGNGFRYAYNDSFLRKYAMLGLHEAYNSQHIVDELKANADMKALFFEDIFLRNKMNWEMAISAVLNFVKEEAFGVELDVDCIENVLSSAATPVGINTQQALQYLYQCGFAKNAAYLHLPEGVSQRADGLQNNFTGKLLSYLVQAFCKGVQERSHE